MSAGRCAVVLSWDGGLASGAVTEVCRQDVLGFGTEGGEIGVRVGFPYN